MFGRQYITRRRWGKSRLLGVTECVRIKGNFDDWDAITTPGIYQNGASSEKFGLLVVFNAGSYKVQLHFFFGSDRYVRWRQTTTSSFADMGWVTL